ncbi:MAG TPA: NAD-dependent epimerase/dehydratase family protein [Gemmatimonadaceae bacterium]|nr:NAD-dependent epimerase/dehydratase family protein [Gemmatimonadaceae bacterium]
MDFWKDKRVVVTGGCSFIGSHLADALVARGASVRLVDNLSSGKLDNVRHLLANKRVEFLELDLLDPKAADRAVADSQYVFHLAATHGGRGFIDLHQAACATNLALDGLVIRAAHRAGVEKFVFASSGCVYPEHLQTDPNQTVYLSEDMVKPPYAADNLYGWAKLMAELTLRAYHQDYGFQCVSLRYFTAYGERCLENHAVMAMIARAFIRQDPFVVWGTGEQVRNWTYVGDIVEGTIRAAERIGDGTAINLGTTERIRVIDAAREVLRLTNVKARIQPDPSKPTGPYNRVCDNSLAKKLLDWEPKVSFSEGLERTIRWYFATKDREQVGASFERLLTER